MVVELSLSWTAENIHVVPPSQTINAFAFNDRVTFSPPKINFGLFMPKTVCTVQCICIVREELLFDLAL